MPDHARLLRQRADTYSRDARTLADEPDPPTLPTHIAYQTIADELRQVARQVEDDGAWER